jgi:AmmeMemoRadiSam system protein B
VLTPDVRPLYAAGFYPGDASACRQAVRQAVASITLPEGLPSERLGGLVPHAGWMYSGRTAAALWAALAAQATHPDTIVLLGAVHVPGVRQASVWDGDAWETPLGDVEVDRELAADVVERSGGAVIPSRQAHEGEHSLEVQVPFIRELLPDARILPIAVPADGRAPGLGHRIALVVRAASRRVAVVASSDLTHYGERYGFAPMGTGRHALAWSRQNDKRLVDLVLAFQPASVLAEADTHRNACGSGAIAAAIATASDLGARRAVLLDQCTSHDAQPTERPSLFVGYASVLWGR